MICAYCGKEARATKEHIISSGVLDLFPECYLTVDAKRGVTHQADPMVKDVCAECNNVKLSYIDSFAKQLIEKYFLKKYEPDDLLEFEYNYILLQKMLLKYAYNDLRARQDDTSFFSAEIIEYLLNESITAPLPNVSILAGVAVNTSPVPDFIFGNLKLQWCKSPIFMANSLVKNIDYATGQINLREKDELKKQEFMDLVLSYIFRFNSGQFVILCWDKRSLTIDKNLNFLRLMYPYSILSGEESSTQLMRCTNEATYHYFQLIDAIWSNGIMDEISNMRSLANDNYQKTLDDMNNSWLQEETRLAEEHKR